MYNAMQRRVASNLWEKPLLCLLCRSHKEPDSVIDSSIIVNGKGAFSLVPEPAGT
jgi:hypothetical protein